MDGTVEAMGADANRMTLDEVVSYNLRRARGLRGWTQAEAAGHISSCLGRVWSQQVYGDAERAYQNPKRVKIFTGEEMLALSVAFDLHITWFYIPPETDNQVAARESLQSIDGEELVLRLLPSHADAASAARTDALRDRLGELAPDGKFTAEIDQRPAFPERLRKGVYRLLMERAVSDQPDSGAVSDFALYGLLLGLFTKEEVELVRRVHDALAPVRHKVAEARKAAQSPRQASIIYSSLEMLPDAARELAYLEEMAAKTDDPERRAEIKELGIRQAKSTLEELLDGS